MRSSDVDRYLRGLDTLVACWTELARGASGAAVHRLRGVAAAVFPSGPERAVYNNAILAQGLDAVGRDDAIEAMENAYASAGVTSFAAWVHEEDAAMRRALERRGYAIDTTTRAMAMDVADVRLPRPELELAELDWREYVRLLDMPPDFLLGVDRTAFHILLARLDGETVATATAFDHGGDCAIVNVGTLEHARRRGLATALTALQVHEAAARGCRTASLQATEQAERVYAAVGFRDLGRIVEYVPSRAVQRTSEPSARTTSHVPPNSTTFWQRICPGRRSPT